MYIARHASNTLAQRDVHESTVNMLAALGERCKLPQPGPGQSPGRKCILEHFPAKKTHLVTGGSNFVSKRR